MSMIGDDAVSGTRERSVAEILGWRQDGGDTQYEPFYVKGDGSYGHGEPTPDDMLAWLRRRCSQIRIDPIRIHEVGYTLDCTDETEPMQPNRVMASVTAPTLRAALEHAVRAVAEAEGGAG